MIGQTIKMHQKVNGVSKISLRKIDSESYQYGRRIYEMTDPETGEHHTGIADDIDRWFRPVNRRAVLPKGSKGASIIGKQKNWL